MEYKPKPIIKAFPPVEFPKSVRARYTSTSLRDIMLRAQGLPEAVIPYGINEDAEVIYPGNGTPMVRSAVLSGFEWAFSECVHNAEVDAQTLYKKFPGLHGESRLEESTDLRDSVKSGELRPSAAAIELERRTRESRPSLTAYAPANMSRAILGPPMPMKKRNAVRIRNKEIKRIWGRRKGEIDYPMVCRELDQRGFESTIPGRLWQKLWADESSRASVKSLIHDAIRPRKKK
jgi:hypothetical protein